MNFVSLILVVFFQERRPHEAQEYSIVKSVNEQIVKIQDGLHIEQKTREDSENSLVKVPGYMCQKMQAEVQLERQDREGTEEIFLKLLEENMRPCAECPHAISVYANLRFLNNVDNYPCVLVGMPRTSQR